jgi:hypothetical protein
MAVARIREVRLSKDDWVILEQYKEELGKLEGVSSLRKEKPCWLQDVEQDERLATGSPDDNLLFKFWDPAMDDEWCVNRDVEAF